jgi:hypothetical protein
MLTQTALVVTVETGTSRSREEIGFLQPSQQFISTRALDVARENTNEIFFSIQIGFSFSALSVFSQ